MVCVKLASRRRLLALLPIVMTAFYGSSCAQAMDKTISVVIDQAHLVDLPAGTATLIIGNPTIADVTMIGSKNSLMVLTPKSFGETNFIALDVAGKPLSESIIRVVAGTETLIVQRGMDRESYACAPKCQSTGKLGDDAKYFDATTAQGRAYNTNAASLAPPVSAATGSASSSR